MSAPSPVAHLAGLIAEVRALDRVVAETVRDLADSDLVTLTKAAQRTRAAADDLARVLDELFAAAAASEAAAWDAAHPSPRSGASVRSE